MEKSNRTQHRVLFWEHVRDLQQVSPGAGDVFLCPVCFKLFPAAQLDDYLRQGILTIGHVWPQHLRAKSSAAQEEKVLLCKNCNNRAGTSGDDAMQQFEEFRRTRESGQMYRPRVRAFPPLGTGQPLDLGSTVAIEVDQDKPGARVTFQHHPGTGLPLYDPQKKRKFAEHMMRGDCSLQVTEGWPFRERWPLAQAGWLTSAYLAMFHRFGYRYVLQSRVDPVRRYITDSFHKQTDDRLEFDAAKDMAVWICRECWHDSPTIWFVLIAANARTPQHIKVSYYGYHVRLPVSHGPSDSKGGPQAMRQALRERKATDLFLKCDDAELDDPSAQRWLLGEPEYRVEGLGLVSALRRKV